MEMQEELYRETKLMEPILRMHKLIAAEDDLKANTLLAVVVQYITDHYQGQVLTPADVQKIIRAVLLREEDGRYFAMYLRNELQVKLIGWLMLLAADLPVTLEQLGDISVDFDAKLAKQPCLSLTGEEVLVMARSLVEPLEPELWQRMELNEAYYLAELDILLQSSH